MDRSSDPSTAPPAELTFAARRADYEAVVRLAQQQGLGHTGTCGYAFALPVPYTDLSRDCVFLVEDPALAIAFHPRTSRRIIAYAENLAALAVLDGCGVDGSVFKQIDTHWYLCTPSQD